MLTNIKRLLDDEGYDYYDNLDEVVVDCGGQDYNYMKLVCLIGKHIEEWTYNILMNIKIEINTGFELVIFKAVKDYD